MFSDDYSIEDLGIVPIDNLTTKERIIKEFLQKLGNANIIFFEPLTLENKNLLESPQEHHYYDENSDIETLEVMRGGMNVQDAIWYCATKAGLSQNSKMFSNRLHRLFPKDKDFRRYSWQYKDKKEEKERKEQEEREREEREKKLAKDKELRYKEEIEFAARVMAHQEARRHELNYLATEESDKLGFLFKECGKMILSLNKMPMEGIDNNYLKNITNEQSKNFNFAYQQFNKFITEEKRKKENNMVKTRERTLAESEV